MNRLMDALPLFAGLFDTDGRTLAINETAYAILDPDARDVIGMYFWETPWWRHDAAVREQIRAAVLAAGGGETRSLQCSFVYRDDSLGTVEILAQPLRRPDGGVDQVLVTGMDVTGRVAEQQKVLDSERQRRLTLEAAELGTWELDLADRTVRWDARCREIFRFNGGAETALDRVIECIVPEERPVLDEAVAAAQDPLGDGHYAAEYRLVTDGDGPTWCRAVGRCFFRPEPDAPGGRVADRFFGVAMDITQQKLSERRLDEARRVAEAANQAKSAFLANMSHEIRTPMTAILGYADILARHLKDPDNQALVQTIRGNGRFLLEILNDVLDLAKIESGRLSIQRETFAPESVVEEVVSLMEVRARSGGITLQARFDTLMPPTLHSDPIRLRQVLLNLVSNAIKFTERGGVELRVSVEDSGDDAAAELCFDVIDSGIGIDAATLTGLFQPFTQADDSVQRRYGGTGLGLAISRRLAEALGGTLTAESTPGVGSRFRLCLPLSEVSTADRRPVMLGVRPTHPAEVRSLGSTGDLRGRRILAVDDRRDMRALVRYLLEEAGAEVISGENGQEAVDRIDADAQIDVVVMDMQMPVMDGYSAAARIRERGLSLPIIAVTAHAMPGEREACLNAGCSAYTTKPLDGEHLIRLIHEQLAPTD